MNRITLLIILFTAFTNSAFSQKFRITPNNNQYYYTDYIQKEDSGSILKIILIFSVTDAYKPTYLNPEFSWSDGSGKLNANMIMPGKYQIDLNVVYKKTNANTIAFSEFSKPRIINVNINDLHRVLIKIEYVTNLTVEYIEKKISTFNPLESKYEDLIYFIYDYNDILRKYDPFCELILPEIVTDDFSKKITQTINSDWKKTKFNVFQSTCKDLNKSLKNSEQNSAVVDLINCLSQTNQIKLNHYNAYRIDYLTGLLEYRLTLSAEHSGEIDNQIMKSFQAIKQENIDSTDRQLIVTHVTRNGFQMNNLSVAYSPAVNPSPELNKIQKEYFKCPSSPSYSIFSNSNYLIWVESKDKKKVSTNKFVNPADGKYKEIVLPVNSSLAIVRLQNDFGQKLHFDAKEFDNEIKKLIIRYKCLFLTNISVPVI